MREQFVWPEKYRPHTIEECILPVDLTQIFKQMVVQGNIPNLLLVGPPGLGKTTVARALLEELDCDYIFVPCGLDGNIDTIRNQITQFASSVSFKGKRKYVILDEADSITYVAQGALRNFMERYAKNCGFILTANFQNKIILPLQSRCSVVEFTNRKVDRPKIAARFFKRVCEILTLENIPFQKEAVIGVINKHFPDFRRILNELQKYSMSGTIDSGILNNLKGASITALIPFLKDKDFTNVRKWVGENVQNDAQTIFREFYDTAAEHFAPSFVAELVTILAKYQHMAVFVVDQEINLASCLVEIMIQSSWR
jgi:DNA polymerase III delta prime subunit